MKILKAKRGISTIIAVLLMIVIAVAAAVITYIWIMGYLGGTMSKIAETSEQEKINIDNVGKFDNNTVQVVVRNIGEKTVTLSTAYVNDIVASSPANELAPGDTVTLNVDIPSAVGTAWASGTQYTVKVVCKFGGPATRAWTAP